MGVYSTAFLRSAADILSVFVFLLALTVVVEIARMSFEQNKSIDSSLTRVKSALIPGFIQFGFMKLAFSSHLNFKHMTFTGP